MRVVGKEGQGGAGGRKYMNWSYGMAGWIGSEVNVACLVVSAYGEKKY